MSREIERYDPFAREVVGEAGGEWGRGRASA